MSKILRFEQTETQRLLKLLTQNSKFVEVPTQFGKQTYTGEEQAIRLPFIDWDRLEYGGTLSATNAGTYTATVKPRPGIKWADGSEDTKEISWTIDKYKILWTEILAPEFFISYSYWHTYIPACMYDGKYHHPLWSEQAFKYSVLITAMPSHPGLYPKKNSSKSESRPYGGLATIRIKNNFEIEQDEELVAWESEYGSLEQFSIALNWYILE